MQLLVRHPCFQPFRHGSYYIVHYITCLRIFNNSSDIDKCTSELCLPIPFLIWVGFNALVVMVGSLLTAFIEVCCCFYSP